MSVIKIAPGDIDSVLKDVFQTEHGEFVNKMKDVLSRRLAGKEFTEENLLALWTNLCGNEAETYAKAKGLSDKKLEEISELSTNALNTFIARKKEHGASKYGTAVIETLRKKDGGPC